MNKKVIRIAAVISAAALLCGGIYLLVKNDVAQRINRRDIMIYAPTPIARETLDETVDIEKSKPSADRVPEDTKEELTEQVRQLSNEHGFCGLAVCSRYKYRLSDHAVGR